MNDMLRRLLLLPLLALLVFLAACGGRTTTATVNGDGTVTLNGSGYCEPGDNGFWYFEYRNQAESEFPWSTGSQHRVDCPTGQPRTPASGESPLNENIGQVADGTYDFRVCFAWDNGQHACADKDGTAEGTNYSTFTKGSTPPPPTGDLLGIDWSQVSSTVAASVTSEANQTGLTADIGNQDSRHDTYTLANAMIARKTGNSTALSKACAGLAAVIGSQSSSDRALSIGRGLQAYVYAASLVDCGSAENTFRTWVATMQDYTTTSGPSSLRACADERPNNWGTHCRASMALSAIYLGQTSEIADQLNLFRAWVGDPSGSHTFDFSENYTDWATTTPAKGINPVGATKNGYNVDGVLPDDQRRPEGCTTNTPASPCDQDYVYEALQGVVIEALALEAAGYDAFGLASQAIKRAYVWERDRNAFLPSGDDRSFAYIAQEVYGLTGLNLSGDQQGKGFVGGQWVAPGVTATP